MLYNPSAMKRPRLSPCTQFASGGWLASSIRHEIWQVDPEVSIPPLKSLDEQVSDSVALY